MTAIASATSAATVDELVERFGVLCDRAADIGALVHLEFIPMTAVADIATAWRIVRDADRPNGGILFDTWHFFRGAADFDALQAVPGERIFAVQVDDALPDVSGSPWEDTQQRLLPGDGCFELPRVLRTLARIGGLRRWDPKSSRRSRRRCRRWTPPGMPETGCGAWSPTRWTRTRSMDDQVELLLAERAIARVLATYCRGADRLDLELTRSCHWPDGTDDHGSYRGGVDDFIEFVGPALQRFERTNHFLGNTLIDVDLTHDVARAETYAVAYHRFHDADGQEMDMVAGLRYVDRFERRGSSGGSRPGCARSSGAALIPSWARAASPRRTSAGSRCRRHRLAHPR